MRAGQPSVTARWVAAQRLRLEGTRPSTPGGDVAAEHRLYRAIAGGVTAPVGRSSVLALRTQVVDAEVARAIGRGTTQIVLLGAGYDGRALRFGGGAVRWFEVDRPATLEDKRRRLAELGVVATGVTNVGLDLLDADRRDDTDAALGCGRPRRRRALAVRVRRPVRRPDARGDGVPVRRAARTGRPGQRAGGHLLGGARRRRRRCAPLRSASALVRQVTDEPRRNEFRPGDPEKLMVVTGWRVTHTESSAERRLDPGAHTLMLVCEPDPARRV